MMKMNLVNLLTSSPGGRSVTKTFFILPLDLRGGNHKQNENPIALSFHSQRDPAFSIAIPFEKKHHASHS